MRRIMIVAAAAASLLLAQGAQATLGRFNPDALIKGGSAGPDFIGDNIDNTTGANQTARKRLEPGEKVMFEVGAENDGSENDSFRFKGCRGNRRFRVSYTADGMDVTDDIVAGKLTTLLVTPGLLVEGLFMKIKVKSRAEPGDRLACKVKVFSKTLIAEVDVVRGIVKVV